MDFESAAPGRTSFVIPGDCAGVTYRQAALSHCALNDANAIEALFRKHADKIGAFLIEPIMGNCCGISATPEYLRDIRNLCDKYDVLLIIDEVKTGFRVTKGGAKEL